MIYCESTNLPLSEELSIVARNVGRFYWTKLVRLRASKPVAVGNGPGPILESYTLWLGAAALGFVIV